MVDCVEFKIETPLSLVRHKNDVFRLQKPYNC